ncbi:MAG: hypothetical protein AB7S38_30310 [Vulcanimicrobiota bacterium]
MKVGSMPRSQAMEALRRQQQKALSEGDETLAGTISTDLATLQGVRGDTVYDMYNGAQRKSEVFRYWSEPEMLGRGAKAGAVLGTVVGVGVSLANAQPVLGGLVAGAVFGGLGGVMAATMVAMFTMNMSDPGAPILAALERSSVLLAREGQNPTPPLPVVSRGEILEQLTQDHQRYSDLGDLPRAFQLDRGAKYFSAHSEMGLSQLHTWAVENRNGATIGSLHSLLSRRLSAEELKQYLQASTSQVDLDWMQDEVRVGDQSLPVTK